MCLIAAVVNLILFLTKLYVAISSNSISIYVDSLNSLADTAICIIAIIGFRIISKKPSERFPFGFGRVEDIINFVLSLIILFTGAAFVYTSLQRLMYPVPVWYSSKYAIIISITAIVKLLMIVYYKVMNRKLPSQVLSNLGVDSILDFFISVCIVISFTLTNKIGYSVDAVTGIITSVIIIVCGIKSIFSCCCKIIGSPAETDLQPAREIITANKNITEINELNCHTYGELKVYTATLTVNNITAEELKELTLKLNSVFQNRLNAKIYISIGGTEK